MPSLGSSTLEHSEPYYLGSGSYFLFCFLQVARRRVGITRKAQAEGDRRGQKCREEQVVGERPSGFLFQGFLTLGLCPAKLGPGGGAGGVLLGGSPPASATGEGVPAPP